MGEIGVSLVIILSLLGIVIAILWVLMPFAVFGLKDLAKSLIAEQQRTNTLLAKLAAAPERKE